MPTPSPAWTSSAAAAGGRSVLVVDDENGVRDLMSRWLRLGGYAVSSASDADQALDLVKDEPPAVALCDIRMPGHDGLWLADRIRHDHPETAVIMATGVHDVGAAVESLRHGVVDYLTKPFDRDRLSDAVVRAYEWHCSAVDARRWREALEVDMHRRHARLKTTIAGLRIDTDQTLDAMLSKLTADDRDAYAHAYRVAALSTSMARVLGLDQADIATIERGALLHDLGKLAMPQALLRKPAPLTPDERTMIRLHPRLGSELIDGVRYLSGAAQIVRDAHERVDGRGYPRGIGSDALPMGARIVTVADAYDTMTRPRVFRDAVSPRAALSELERCCGTQFDAAAVGALRRVLGVER
ncbi:MAG TPA: HD domain-containing phosphohydrolase [Vicinamibacterales bacterium]|nr:HD domain-containing phosphohydrolase [Vicinamibacterales bacterium]